MIEVVYLLVGIVFGAAAFYSGFLVGRRVTLDDLWSTDFKVASDSEPVKE